MNLLDIISLAKAGYKKSDIDELLAIQVDEPEQQPQPDSTDINPAPEGGSGASPEQPDDKPDYEQLYKEILEQVNILKEDLKVAQEQNRRTDISKDKPDPMDDLADVFRSYM